MSSSISSTLIIVFIPFILLLFSTSHAASSSPLIKKICHIVRKDYDVEMCDKTLESEPRVASARNIYDLSIEVMKSGISRSKRTRRHIRSLLKKNSTNPKAKAALEQCKSSYDWAIGSTRSALAEVKEGEYQTATYDLLLAATDCIRDCQEVVTSKVIKDKIIVRGNKLAKIFGLSAVVAVDRIPST
ncbi:hypothetical protein AAHA92_07215 [Salvia divinorum]|uniref:Pectinesterase inhibitor domain-containing protein n=1 Tax=Salvia divinorum TaxID=28513 RepID=A0ABD1I888_SALDI